MNFLNLKYFLTIAEERNISVASRKLYVSQQALSEHLKKMEAELQVTLFQRKNPLVLTEAGKCFYKGAWEILNIYRQTLSDITEINNGQSVKLIIGIPTYCEPYYLPDVLVNFHDKYPECQVTIVKKMHSDISHSIGNVDLYLSYLPLSEELENYVLFGQDPYCVAFQEKLALDFFGDEWAEVEQQLLHTGDLNLLREMPFLILLDRYGQFSMDLSKIFGEYGFDPNISFSFETGELVDKFCLRGYGCMLATQSYINYKLLRFPDNRAKSILSYPIHITCFEPKIAISYAKHKNLRTIEKAFIKEASDYFENYAFNGKSIKFPAEPGRTE